MPRSRKLSAGFCLLIGLAMFAIQQGCSVSRVTPSWFWGTVWFLAAIVLVVLAIWSWDETVSHHRIRKSLFTLVAIVVMSGFSYAPIAKQYRAEHKAELLDVTLSSSGSEHED